MAIIHYDFVPHQSKSINQWLISQRDNLALPTHALLRRRRQNKTIVENRWY